MAVLSVIRIATVGAAKAGAKATAYTDRIISRESYRAFSMKKTNLTFALKASGMGT